MRLLFGSSVLRGLVPFLETGGGWKVPGHIWPIDTGSLLGDGRFDDPSDEDEEMVNFL